jgi:hypothetical protein
VADRPKVSAVKTGGRAVSVHGVELDARGSGWHIRKLTSTRGADAGTQFDPVSLLQFAAPFVGPHALYGEIEQIDVTRTNVVLSTATIPVTPVSRLRGAPAVSCRWVPDVHGWDPVVPVTVQM